MMRAAGLAAWILRMASSLRIRGSGDRASVQHDHIGHCRFAGEGKATLTQVTLDGGTVRLGGAAAELFDKKSAHCDGPRECEKNQEAAQDTSTGAGPNPCAWPAAQARVLVPQALASSCRDTSI